MFVKIRDYKLYRGKFDPRFSTIGITLIKEPTPGKANIICKQDIFFVPKMGFSIEGFKGYLELVSAKKDIIEDESEKEINDYFSYLYDAGVLKFGLEKHEGPMSVYKLCEDPFYEYY